MATKLAAHDLTDPELFASGIPQDVFVAMRAEPELVWTADSSTIKGFWSVTRMADLVAVSRDHGTFSSELGQIQMYDIDEDVRRTRASMIDLDPPIHTHLRRLVSSVFTPRYTQSYESAIRHRVIHQLDSLEQAGDGDWVHDVAAPIPIGVICDIMGVPPEDHGLMIEMSDYLVAGTGDIELDPHAYGNVTPLRELPFNSPAAFGIFDYARKIRAQRLSNPTDDLLSTLATVEIDGERLSENDYARFFQLMIFAGNETTRSSMAHLAMHMASFPAAFERVRDGRGLLDSAVDEVLRYSSPILYFRRTATRDTVLSGTPIAAGDKVVMWYAAANFDGVVFPDPLRFDVDRPRLPSHVAFGGGGVHFCLGAALARLEVAILIEEILRRNITIELAAAPIFVRSNFVNGIESLRVRVVPNGQPTKR